MIEALPSPKSATPFGVAIVAGATDFANTGVTNGATLDAIGLNVIAKADIPAKTTFFVFILYLLYYSFTSDLFFSLVDLYKAKAIMAQPRPSKTIVPLEPVSGRS